MEVVTDDATTKIATENLENDAVLSKVEEVVEEEEESVVPKQQEKKKKIAKKDDEQVTEDSPIMGVLTPKADKGAAAEAPVVDEGMVEKALWERADHFIANSDTLTLVGVRRLLEEDLGLDKHALDPFKKFISGQIDQVLRQPKEAKSSKSGKKKASPSKQSGSISGSSGDESDKTEDEAKPRKKAAPPRKNKILEDPKKRKRSKESDKGVPVKKQNKLAKSAKEEDSGSDGHGSVSEDDESNSSVRRSAQRKEAAPVYGKRVEHLRSVIKACGMSVGPTIYKKAKQVPESKREAFIVKELEEILTREGLSKNPSEKEIKDCKKRKETAKELEGIDMSNIISSTRRRSTFSFSSPPEPEKRVKKVKSAEKDSKIKENSDTTENNDDKEEKDDAKKDEVEEEEEEQEEDEEEEEEEEEDEDEESEEFNEDDNEESD